jgi:hypothetical protein
VARASVNKSEAIRQYYTAHPKAKPKQVVAGLEDKGIEVRAQTVSTVRYAMRAKKKGRGKAGRAASEKATPGRRAAGNGRGAKLFESLVEAKKLSDRLGGVGRARQALKMLEQLT